MIGKNLVYDAWDLFLYIYIIYYATLIYTKYIITLLF